MNTFVSHFTAAYLLKIPYVENVLGPVFANPDLCELTATNIKDHSARKGYKIYLDRFDLPRDSVIDSGCGLIASPELVFLQLATKLSVQRLILFGMQLCSHPPGEPAKAITSKKRLKSFLDRTRGHAGQVKARRALKYIENGSASIMESLAYMVINLPNALGGYGLGPAQFNYEISLKDAERIRLRQQRCFADIYYKTARVALEYDSFTFHNNPLDQGRDGVRAAILHRYGIKVISMNTIQLYDPKACDDLAQNLAGVLGKRIEIRTGKYVEMKGHLRNLFPYRTNENKDVD